MGILLSRFLFFSAAALRFLHVSRMKMRRMAKSRPATAATTIPAIAPADREEPPLPLLRLAALNSEDGYEAEAPGVRMVPKRTVPVGVELPSEANETDDGDDAGVDAMAQSEAQRRWTRMQEMLHKGRG